MDYTVQLVSSQDCHVALPQSLIQLLSTAADFPPVPLYLELRTSGRSNASLTPQPRQVWHLAWMGLTASGPDLEVSQALGECIGLPAGSSVRIKVRRAEDIPVGTSIELEPASSDDWEALELNQTYLEEQILTQVFLRAVIRIFTFRPKTGYCMVSCMRRLHLNRLVCSDISALYGPNDVCMGGT